VHRVIEGHLAEKTRLFQEGRERLAAHRARIARAEDDGLDRHSVLNVTEPLEAELEYLAAYHELLVRELEAIGGRRARSRIGDPV
jgi:hypothetical protein